jgi:molybdopterin-guanine dinucleotide biosynthesis protein A
MGTEKGLQQLCGKPLISYAIEALSDTCSKIIISSSTDVYQDFGYQVVADEFPGLGPMGGIYSALRKSNTEMNIVLSCDLPFVSRQLIAFILSTAPGYLVAVPWLGEKHYEPLCGFYSLALLENIEAYIRKGNYKLPDLFEEISINKLIISNKYSFYQGNLFLNVNSKHDLAIAENMMKSKK